MELKELEYIVAIADAGSISRASERLFLAQSSVSQFLSRVEAELGCKLFTRTANGVRSTLSGDIYIRNARELLHRYRMLRTELQDMNCPSEGRIEFGISSFRGEYLMPDILCRFHQLAPAVDVILHELNSMQLQKKIAAGELDAALAAFPEHEYEADNQQTGKWIKDDEVLIVAHKEHPVMQYVHTGAPRPMLPWVDLSEIMHLEFLLSDRSTILGKSAYYLFDSIGACPISRNSKLTAAFAAAMARKGLGLAFTYRSCANEYPDVEYISIGPRQYFIKLTLLYPPDGYRSRAVRALERVMLEELQS